MIETSRLRYEYGETEYAELKNRLQDLSAEELLRDGVIDHKNCDQDLTHKGKIERPKARFEKGTLVEDVTHVRQKKRGRPSLSLAEDTLISPSSRRRAESFDKTKCVLCQDAKVDIQLQDVTTENVGSQLIKVGQETNYSSLQARLSNLVASEDPLSAVAYDMKYYLACLVKANREVNKKNKPASSNSSYCQVILDLEILEVIELELNSNSGIILNMNDIHTTYVNILEENGFRVPENPRYKQYLKQLIQDNIIDVHFNRPLDKTKPEQVLSTKSKEEAVSIYAKKSENLKEDLQILTSAAKILRTELGNSPSWKFTGTFDDYSPPQILYSFCKHAIQGTEKSRLKEEKHL